MKYVLKHKSDNLYLSAIDLPVTRLSDFNGMTIPLSFISKISKNPATTFQTKNTAMSFLDEYRLRGEYDVKRVYWFTEKLWGIKPFKVSVEQYIQFGEIK